MRSSRLLIDTEHLLEGWDERKQGREEGQGLWRSMVGKLRRRRKKKIEKVYILVHMSCKVTIY